MEKKTVFPQVAIQDSISLQTAANKIFVAAGMENPKMVSTVLQMVKKTVK